MKKHSTRPRWQAVVDFQRSKTHCPKGHAYTTSNTIFEGSARRCRACRIALIRARSAAPLRLPTILPDRFWAKVDHNGPVSKHRPDLGHCWLWTAKTTEDGYGQTTFLGKDVYAHRATYLTLIGDIATGLQLDHLCRVRNCVHPLHVEPVTPGVNTSRGLGAKGLRRASHCSNGHLLDEMNTDVWRNIRRCKICRTRSRAQARASMIAKQCMG